MQLVWTHERLAYLAEVNKEKKIPRYYSIKKLVETIVEQDLIDQLQRLRGAMGQYNCQHGGNDCQFQTNYHRLIEEELELLKDKNIV